MALIRHLGQLAADIAELYKSYRGYGLRRWTAVCKTVTNDTQTKAVAACMAVLCLAIFSAIVLTFGPGGYFFNK